MFTTFFKTMFCSESRKTSSKGSPNPCEEVSRTRSSGAFEIPSQTGKYLVLDLDETLIYTRMKKFGDAQRTYVSSHFLINY